MNGNGINNGFDVPPPPVQPPPLVPPMVNSVYNIITRRIRLAKTIFDDRVKLVLTQNDTEQWSQLQRPYLLVVPTQVRQPTAVEPDLMGFTIPRVVTFIAHFDARNSEREYLAANEIDTTENQLIYVLAKWRPELQYQPTRYGGMKIQATREPDVKVLYTFTFNEDVALLEEPPVFPGEDVPGEVVLDGISIHVNDPTCAACPCVEEDPCASLPIRGITGGGCPCEPAPDPCAPDPCPSPLEGGDAAPQT